MDARNFRYLFENVLDGIVQSGCIWDTISEKKTNYAYVCGMRNRKEAIEREPELELRVERNDNPCHIFVLASYSVYYIRKMIKMIRHRKIETILLPYVAPVQRIVISQWYDESLEENHELQAFMDHPYLYLKNSGIENIYILYGNGANLEGDPDCLASGHHFELADSRDLESIREMEGHYVPVVKAGYIVENSWLFYFGNYGRSIQMYEQFSTEYGGPERNAVSYKSIEEWRLQMKQIIYEYTKQFGAVIDATIVMFQGPLHTSPRENDSMMTGKLFSKEQPCLPEIPADGRNCMLRCIYRGDYGVYGRHKRKDRSSTCFGVMLLGNVNLNRFFPELSVRYSSVIGQARAISLPGCGNRDYWNRHCLTWLVGEDIKYWVCGLDRETSPAVVSDVVVSSPQNRVVTVSEEYGYCFSGYLVPAVEKE